MEIEEIIKKCKEKRKLRGIRKEVFRLLSQQINKDDSAPYFSVEFLKKTILNIK